MNLALSSRTRPITTSICPRRQPLSKKNLPRLSGRSPGETRSKTAARSLESWEDRTSAGSNNQSTDDDIKAKLAAAKRYKENVRNRKASQTGEPNRKYWANEVVDAVSSGQTTSRQTEDSELMERFASSGSEILKSQEAELLEAIGSAASSAPPSNVSEAPAAFLAGSLDRQRARNEGAAAGIRPGQRMEDYMLEKENEQRQAEVEIISVDKEYKPKVSSWGVFPRPGNISKTYGGGRTIAPGQVLESDEDRAAREQRVKSRVLAYRMSQGLVIDEETEAECRGLYERGLATMKAGRLQEAAELFEAAESKVVLKSSWGGRCRLQRALCYDSMALTDEARALYKQISNHPEAEVAKRAKQMMFGIQSMDFLKTHTMSYGVGEGYAEYFKRIQSDWNTVYTPNEETGSDPIWESAIAVAVMATPLIGIGALALMK
eukprot:CAMPEP_0177600210 /NCGR_PEP_ID=MMETSP0419_2-20121207/13479_1 /TAXON_ID=582737 /ORGANISM="Tetraselmis sp., Strain GSL018" /LENGTH=433 /DNA_ID=CAMNT_0019093143 /DNA_START=329 /DNA_END=1630 /DNA_ORIENTATION=-